MIWLTWRQFRGSALTALIGLTVLAIYFVVLGLSIRSSYQNDLVGCQPAVCDQARRLFLNTYAEQVGLSGALLIAVPALAGVFWGAPLIARELEENTHRLVWNQSVTRTHWLAVKLGLVTLFAVVVTGLFSVLLTWSASRFDQVNGDRFGALLFASRNVAPLGYALFAVLLGAVVGLLLRRTVLAMAVTLAVFAVVQVLMGTVIRSHFMPPVTATVILDQEAMRNIQGMGMNDVRGRIFGYTIPGSWSMSEENDLYKPDGSPFTVADAKTCMGEDDMRAEQDCQAKKKLYFTHSYHPADRYWSFQWIELGIFVGLSLLLAALAFRRIRQSAG
ncbi:ABC-type transport system involved in multi-copper enzyme maturation permease subunit [Actinoplanes lutulentus]|uniref:ABC-2 family transporter n=1 Tax=Actinoplanes lutulentus TaxID=1287878 RepID=A0A327Z2B6_9ACTN|nr:ABC transporter permease subunit [Actinoplanes lutulentus]MBB2940330.1 ABC-type transport system involved in multi-copper enzyme maturation permease subunit [Actinoplanes lutulentus]RAK28823.1 ABC-2 family transporter [Actinoplanes lutulentus]